MAKNIKERVSDYEDLSHRNRSSKDTEQDLLTVEFDFLASGVSSRIKGDFPLSYNVKVPANLSDFLKDFSEGAWNGLVALILQTGENILYDKLAADFLATVFNLGIEYNELPDMLKKPVSIDLNTRLHRVLDEVVEGYKDIGDFLYHDYSNFEFPEVEGSSHTYSANDIYKMLTSAQAEANFIRRDFNNLKSDFEAERKMYKSQISDLSLKISDLSGINASLRNEILELKIAKAKYDAYRYYHLGLPRLIRYLGKFITEFNIRLKSRRSKK